MVTKFQVGEERDEECDEGVECEKSVKPNLNPESSEPLACGAFT